MSNDYGSYISYRSSPFYNPWLTDSRHPNDTLSLHSFSSSKTPSKKKELMSLQAMNAGSCGLTLGDNSLPSESIYESGRVQIYYPSVYRLLQQDNNSGRTSEYGFTTMSDVDVAGTTTTRVLTLSPRKARSVGDPSLSKKQGGHVYDVPQRLLPINGRTKQIQQHHDANIESETTTTTGDHHHHSCQAMSSMNPSGKLGSNNMSSTFTGTSLRPPSFRSLYDEENSAQTNFHHHSRLVDPSSIPSDFSSHLQHEDDDRRVRDEWRTIYHCFFV